MRVSKRVITASAILLVFSLSGAGVYYRINHQQEASGQTPERPAGDLPPRPWRSMPVLRYGEGPPDLRLLCGYLLYSSLVYHGRHALVGLGVGERPFFILVGALYDLLGTHPLYLPLVNAASGMYIFTPSVSAPS